MAILWGIFWPFCEAFSHFNILFLPKLNNVRFVWWILFFKHLLSYWCQKFSPKCKLSSKIWKQILWGIFWPFCEACSHFSIFFFLYWTMFVLFDEYYSLNIFCHTGARSSHQNVNLVQKFENKFFSAQNFYINSHIYARKCGPS